jgi:AcrR family transcriptional regulator
MVHVLGDGDDLIVGVRLKDGRELSILVYVDHNLGTIAKDAFVVPGPIDELVAMMRDHTEVPLDTELREIDPADARAMITQVVEHGAWMFPPFESETWPACRPTFRQDGPRRGRKKRQTRDALIDAALDLLEMKGYERTAVHEITDAVDVSERTFFRYFASKEDVALFFVAREMDAFVQLLTVRPAGEGPLIAVRNAFRLSLEQVQADGNIRNGEPRYLAVISLIDSTPALLAASLRYVYDNSDKAPRVLAEREGVDLDTDLRPWLLVGICATTLALVHRDWRIQDRDGFESMLALFDAYADQLGSTITGRWDASCQSG